MAIRTTTTRTTQGVSEVSANSQDIEITFSEVLEAYLDCRKNKRYKEGSILFETNLNENLYVLYKDLLSKNYEIGASSVFIVTNPKPREVWAADFRDRVVHHIMYNRIAPKINKSFSHNSCACIPDRGTIYGANRLHRGVKRVSSHWREETHYLKMDVKNFFMTIQKNVIQKELLKWGFDSTTMWLINKILFHNPTYNFIYKGDENLKKLVPHYKSLFYCSDGVGLPIGNLSSQFFANVFMNIIDKFIDHTLKPDVFVRYVDDIVIISKDKDFLKYCKVELEKFAEVSLMIDFNNKKTLIHNVNRGVDFVGFVSLPYRLSPRKVLLSKALDKIKGELCYDRRVILINSYLGLMSHSKSYDRRMVILKQAKLLGHTVLEKENKVR